MHKLRLQVERKKAYDKWVKRVAPPMLDADKVGEMQSRVERLKNPAPKKNARDEMKRRVPRRHNERKEIIMDDEGDALDGHLDHCSVCLRLRHLPPPFH